MAYSHEPSHWHSAEKPPKQRDHRGGWLSRTRKHGLAAATVAVISFGMVYHLVQSGVRHPPSIVEMIVALIGFLCASLGSAMILYGRELFDGRPSTSSPGRNIPRGRPSHER